MYIRSEYSKSKGKYTHHRVTESQSKRLSKLQKNLRRALYMKSMWENAAQEIERSIQGILDETEIEDFNEQSYKQDFKKTAC